MKKIELIKKLLKKDEVSAMQQSIIDHNSAMQSAMRLQS